MSMGSCHVGTLKDLSFGHLFPPKTGRIATTTEASVAAIFQALSASTHYHQYIWDFLEHYSVVVEFF